MWIIFLGILGAVLASFAEYVVIRYADKKPLQKRSTCDQCNALLRPHQLIPIFSSLLRIKCACGYRPDQFYAVTELLGAVLLPSLFFYTNQHIFLTTIIFSGLLITFVLDLRRQLVLSYILLFLSSILLIFHALSTAILPYIIGAGCAFIFFSLQWLITKGKGIGAGDIWVGVFLGCTFLPMDLLYVISFGYIVGAIIALIVLATGKRPKQFPLGSFLILGAMVFILYELSEPYTHIHLLPL